MISKLGFAGQIVQNGLKRDVQNTRQNPQETPLGEYSLILPLDVIRKNGEDTEQLILKRIPDSKIQTITADMSPNSKKVLDAKALENYTLTDSIDVEVTPFRGKGEAQQPLNAHLRSLTQDKKGIFSFFKKLMPGQKAPEKLEDSLTPLDILTRKDGREELLVLKKNQSGFVCRPIAPSTLSEVKEKDLENYTLVNNLEVIG